MKYLVFKSDDIERYCSQENEEALRRVALEVMAGRLRDLKPVKNNYLVINRDEPYLAKVKEIVEEHEGPISWERDTQ